MLRHLRLAFSCLGLKDGERFVEMLDENVPDASSLPTATPSTPQVPKRRLSYRENPRTTPSKPQNGALEMELSSVATCAANGTTSTTRA